MSAELNLVPIADLAEVNPAVHLASLRPDSEVSFIPMQDVSETGEWTGGQTRRAIDVRVGYTPFLNGDVLFAKITPCMENGKGAHVHVLANGIGFGSTEFHVLRAKTDACGRFIFHWCQSPALRQKAKAFMSGSAGQQRVQADFFNHFCVPQLPLPEQVRIAEILDTLDEAIRKTEQVIAKLQQMKQGLLHDLLTRGVDENGDLRPPPDQAPHLYKDSVLGRVPKGWEVEPFERRSWQGRPYLKTGPFGTSLKGEHWVEEGVPVITIGALGEGEFIESELLFVSERKARELAAYVVQTGDIVFSRVADVGRSVVVSERQVGWIISSNLMWISLDPATVEPDYLWLNLSANPRVRQQVRRSVNAGGREVANGSVLNSLLVGWPELAEQQRIAVAARAASEQERAERHQAAALRSLKQSLLHDLLTGRVRVPIEKMAEEGV